ncbi:MAG: efflux RND transporter permease subunit [FCB group bacterium]|jgi:HAE1 family hydrophobic/amphiphilic exporter-1|nr:efflux RND transporter permease subunit [FCB group bacterium]
MSEPEPGQLSAYLMPIRRPVTTAMLFLTLVVFGWKSYQQLPINLMPDISYPTLTVRTEYEGAAPEDVEKLITRPLEETLSVVAGMREIRSVSSPGISEIVMEFSWETKMDMAQQDVRDRLDIFEAPPEITEKPVILRFDPTLDPVLRVAITPTTPGLDENPELEHAALTVIREAAERQLKSDLEAEPGIAQVKVKGGQEEEIQILVDSERLKNLGLSVTDVASALTQQNINLSGGSLKEGKTEYLVRTLNEFQRVDEIGRTVITSGGLGAAMAGDMDALSVQPQEIPNNRQIRLEDVAEVRRGVKDRDTIVRVNGREAVELDIYKEGDANTVNICNTLKDLLGFPREKSLFEKAISSMSKAQAASDENAAAQNRQKARNLRNRLPDEVRFTLISDQSRFIIDAIKEVQEAALMGGLLALAVLYLFLRDLKTTFAIGLAIPISVVTAFVPMFLRGISLNTMSLGGLALGIGMLVDNSIVVLESIARCREEGDGLLSAANRGTREVAAAVVASTLTTVAVFLPIAFVEGIAGQIFGDQALTVTFSLLASLLVALFLNPMIASRRELLLTHGSGAVWFLRDFTAGRAAGQGAGAALAAVPGRALRNAGHWFAATARESFSPVVGPFTKGHPGGWLRYPRMFIALLLAPFMLIVFVFHVAIKLVSLVLVTAIFVLGLILVGVVGIIGLVLRYALWLPLALFNVAYERMRDLYVYTLGKSLHFSPVVLAAVTLLAVHAGFVSTTLGRELIPALKQGEFGIRMEAPPGTRLDETERRARAIEILAKNTPEIDSVAVQIGTDRTETTGNRGENVATFSVRLKDPAQNIPRQDDIIAGLRDRIIAVTSDKIGFTLPTMFSFKTAVELQIRGDEAAELRAVGEELLPLVGSVPGVKDADLSLKRGYPEVIVKLDRDLLAAKNIRPEQVAQRLRTEVQGDVASRFSEDGDKIDIRVRADRTRLATLNDLRAISVTDGAPPVPLGAVADVTVAEGPSEVRRVDQREVAIITANVEGRDLGAVSDDILKKVPSHYLPRVSLAGQQRELDTSYRSLMFALLLAAFLVYVVMACQFESLWHPALIMFTCPLAFIGVIYALDWMRISISIVVFIGGIILAGIVVNNAIVLVDYINQLRARGLAKRQAVVEAGKARLRPILMTALTSVLGLLPMVMGGGEGAEMRRPLAVTVIAGLSCATILTLYIIPMLYDLLGGRDTDAHTP